MKIRLSLFTCLVAAACATTTPDEVHSGSQASIPAPAVAQETSAPKSTGPGPVAYLSQLPPIIERDLFFDDPEISGGQLSPDGKFISFLKPYKGFVNIWVKQVDEPFASGRPVTADTQRSIFVSFWSRDSKYILYVQDQGGNENFRVYAVDPVAQVDESTGVPPARDLTPYKNVRAIIYARPKKDPQHIVVGLNDRDPALHDVYRVNLKTGERALLFKNEQNVAEWIMDLNGKLRLGVRQTDDGGTEILRVDGKKLSPVYTCSFEESCQPIRFHKDGRRVYLETNRGSRDLTQLVLFDPRTKKEQLIDSDPQGQVDFGNAIFSEATDELLATAYSIDRLAIYPKNPSFASDYDFLKGQLPAEDIRFVSSTRDDQKWLIATTSDVNPGTAYLFDRAAKKVQPQYRVRPKLKSEFLASMKPVRYPARDGVVIPAYLTLPKNVEPKNLAVIVFPHGGPWARDFWGYNATAQFLANRGYAVLSPNFRGSDGYGKKFLNLGNKQWGTGSMQHDISDGVQWLIAQGIADPHRVGILGGSYGGYATLAGLTFTPELYAAGVDIVGPSNIATLLKSIPPYWGPIKKIFTKRVGDPDDLQDARLIKEQSPLFSAKNIRAPLLVIQGKNDPRVKRAESDQIVVALRDLGLPVHYLVAPDEGHGFRNRENRLAMYTEIENFLADEVGGRAQPGVSDDIKQRLAAITVDVKGVKLSDSSAVASSTISMPPLAGNAIAPSSATYSQAMEMAGRKFEGKLVRTISQDQVEGRPAWKVVDSSTTQAGTGQDEVWLDAKTLLPIRRAARQGSASVDLAVGDKQITGEQRMGARQMPISASVSGPTLLDGASIEIALGGLPLQPGYKTVLRSFDTMMATTHMWTAEVAGKEPLSVKDKKFDTYKVNLASRDDGNNAVVWIEASAPHRIVKSEANVVTPGGVGKVTKVMQESVQ